MANETKLTSEQRVKNGLKLASDILDIHTEPTEVDKAFRNVARMFIAVLSDEEIEFE